MALINKRTIKNASIKGLLKIKNPSFEDLLVKGNVVVTNEEKPNVYIVCDDTDMGYFQGKFGLCLVQIYDNCLTRLEINGYRDRFPQYNGYSNSYKIEDIYSSYIDADSLQSITDFKNIYKDYELDKLN